MHKIISAVFFTGLAFLFGCNGGNSGDSGTGPARTTYAASWPADVEAVYTADVADGTGDNQIAPGGAPGYSSPVLYGPCDLTRVAFGIHQDFLYMTMEFNAVIPSAAHHIQASGEIEEQWVTSMSSSINWNNDGSLSTGAGGEGVDGIDSFVAYKADYGLNTHVYLNYGFPDGDIHNNQGQIEGEIGSGGPGTNYIVARFPVSSIPSYFVSGNTIEWSGWSEAESYDAPSGGNMKYHHYSFDPWPVSQLWTVP